MTDKQENLFSMYTVLCGYLSTRNIIVNSVPAFSRTYEKLRSLVEEIKNFENSMFGLKGSKSDSIINRKIRLATSAALVSEVIYIYSDEKDIPGLRDKTDKNENYFKRLNNTNLLLEANELMKMVSGMKGELSEYGLTGEEINDLADNIKFFEEAVQSTSENDIEIPDTNGSVYKLIGEAKYIIENRLDKYAHRFKYTDPDFYAQYFTARRINETDTRNSKKEESEALVKELISLIRPAKFLAGPDFNRHVS